LAHLEILTPDETMLAAPPLAESIFGYEIMTILWIAAGVVCSCAIPLTAGVAKGHVMLGIIGALITLPVAAFGCCLGLPCGFVLGIVIGLIPNIERPLLSQSEVEQEMRKLRGY
jgi:hypothetical protein